MREVRSHGVRERELGLVVAAGVRLVGDRLEHQRHARGRGHHHELLDVRQLDRLLGDGRDRGIQRGVQVMAGGIGLERDARGLPAHAEVAELALDVHVVARAGTRCRGRSGPRARCAGRWRRARPARAAVTPLLVAKPACRRLVEEPSERNSRMPAARLPAMPSACVVVSASRPRSLHGRGGGAEHAGDRGGVEAARVERLAGRHPDPDDTSLPATSATSSSSPVAPTCSPTASAAGATATLTCAIAPVCVSSKSSAWQPAPFTSAASWAVRPCGTPMADAGPAPPSAAIASRDVRRGVEGVRRQAAAERVEQVQLGRAGHLARDLVERERRGEGGKSLCGGAHRTPFESAGLRPPTRRRCGGTCRRPRGRLACRP